MSLKFLQHELEGDDFNSKRDKGRPAGDWSGTRDIPFSKRDCLVKNRTVGHTDFTLPAFNSFLVMLLPAVEQHKQK